MIWPIILILILSFSRFVWTPDPPLNFRVRVYVCRSIDLPSLSIIVLLDFRKCFDGVVFVLYYPPPPPYVFLCDKSDHFHLEVLKCESSLHLPTNQRAKYALFVHVTVQDDILVSFQPKLKLPRNYCFHELFLT